MALKNIFQISPHNKLFLFNYFSLSGEKNEKNTNLCSKFDS